MRGEAPGARIRHGGDVGGQEGLAVPVQSPMRYEVWIAEQISPTAIAAFPGLAARRQPGGTVLSGPVRDQAHLHGVLARIQTLGLTLLELRQLPD